MRLQLSVLLAALLSIPPSFLHAGAWVQPQGQALYIQNAYFYAAGEAFAPSGQRIDDAGFRKYEFNPYLEYGLSDDVTLGASLLLHYLEQDNASGGLLSNHGLGQAELFARYQLVHDDGLALAVQPLVALPAAYVRSDGPVAGREAWDAEMAFLAGYGFSLWGLHHYVDTAWAYRHRGGSAGDQYRVTAAAGLSVHERWRLVPEIAWTGRAEGAGNLRSVSGQNDYELMRAQLSVQWELTERYTLQLGGFRHVRGEDTGAGGGVMAALWMRW